ncbi:MAG: hypothetical protein QG597_4268, partial [Actinomycetota bacterium]|nr:hypothetical protein [Actinomycetota bacterium]
MGAASSSCDGFTVAGYNAEDGGAGGAPGVESFGVAAESGYNADDGGATGATTAPAGVCWDGAG